MITKYLYDENAYDYHDGGYRPLKKAPGEEHPLNVPAFLKPDRIEGNEIYYTLTAQAGETKILPGKPTHTWGYNGSILGPAIQFETGKTYHVTLKNELDEVTTFHWHGLNIVGPYEDGGPHAPVYPHGERKITFTVDQPAANIWLHPHPCPETARQVWNGLAAPVIITDGHEQSLKLPRRWGVNDFPVVLQDRSYHDNQLDYKADYDVDGTLGDYALVNFSDYQPGQEVILQTDDFDLIKFKIGDIKKENMLLPSPLAEIPALSVDENTPVFKTVMSGMDDQVRLDGKLFDMQRIDTRQQVDQTQIWEVSNTNDMEGGMIHPFHIHGCQFQLIDRNGHAVNPNEHGWKDTIGVNPNETVRIKVKFTKLGIFMYHCHILEHEDTGMMAQIEIFDPDHPIEYHLMPMNHKM
ncbi:multicopper oxidase domain-containing protein [Pediococcus acidilactici]|uniref:multicopper oxidase family protein n=1 Tax=Pediococcus acidilactici TaxID=1254 RepID=UPI0013214889|nr:multicopper oxidase domain-containing protein [Pediococcus acidilactici]KAF0412275.1 multicopper oxidase domain-containing protein [Pediococcus acidilactici]